MLVKYRHRKVMVPVGDDDGDVDGRPAGRMLGRLATRRATERLHIQGERGDKAHTHFVTSLGA